MASYNRRAQRKHQGRQEELPRIRAFAQQTAEEDIFERSANKMFIRDRAWLDPIKRYLDKRKASGADGEFKYFTLPGRRGIDIGVLYKAGLLKKREGKWWNVAICDREYADIVSNRLGTFGAMSRRPLENVLNNPNEPLLAFFPVDVINLDFCDAVLQDNVEQIVHTNLDIIQDLFSIQRGRDFLLLLTHRIGPNEYSGKVKKLFKETVELNLRENMKFKAHFLDAYQTVSVNACMTQLPQFGMLAVAKYIARCAKRYGYRTEEQFAGYYPRQHGHYYMGVNSFEFEPIAREPAKRYMPRFSANNPDLINLSKRVIDQSDESYLEFVATLPGRSLINVDLVLAADASLMRKYTEMGNSYMEWWNEIKD
jgi:hypothetical protein